MDVQPKSLQQLPEAIMSIWTKTAASHKELRQVSRQKGCSTQHLRGAPNKVDGECMVA